MGPFEGLSRDMHDICGAECAHVGAFTAPLSVGLKNVIKLSGVSSQSCICGG